MLTSKTDHTDDLLHLNTEYTDVISRLSTERTDDLLCLSTERFLTFETEHTEDSYKFFVVFVCSS